GWDGAGAGRSWLVGALAVPPHRPPGVASLAAHQSRRQVPPCRAHAVVLAARAGTRRQPAVVRPRDGLCLAGTPGGLYVGSMVGRGVQRPVVSPDGLGPRRLAVAIYPDECAGSGGTSLVGLGGGHAVDGQCGWRPGSRRAL